MYLEISGSGQVAPALSACAEFSLPSQRPVGSTRFRLRFRVMSSIPRGDIAGSGLLREAALGRPPALGSGRVPSPALPPPTAWQLEVRAPEIQAPAPGVRSARSLVGLWPWSSHLSSPSESPMPEVRTPAILSCPTYCVSSVALSVFSVYILILEAALPEGGCIPRSGAQRLTCPGSCSCLGPRDVQPHPAPPAWQMPWEGPRPPHWKQKKRGCVRGRAGGAGTDLAAILVSRPQSVCQVPPVSQLRSGGWCRAWLELCSARWFPGTGCVRVLMPQFDQ